MKKCNFKVITYILYFLTLSACAGGSGGGGSGGGSAPHVVDSTPHDYTILFAALTNTNQLHTGTMRQICDNGNANFRDETTDYFLQDPNTSGGMGCGGAKNVILTAKNTGTDILYVVVSVDGVNQPQEIVQPGATFTFTRGY